MQRFNQYKRIITFLQSAVIIGIETFIFSVVWYGYYIEATGVPFWRRGNWAVIGFYALILFLFTQLYGGFKIGYLRLMDVLYSQILSLICTNIAAFLLVCIIARDYMSVIPILQITLVDATIVIPWILFCKWIYGKLYPPHRMLLIYSDRDPDNLVKKISTRQDKYLIEDMIHIDEGEEKLKAKVLQFESVIICDIPTGMRNIILKFCFQNAVRTYTTPKLSDIIMMSSTNIHLFDTPLLLSKNQGLLFEQKIAKRAFDMIISLFGCIIAAPIMLVIALLVKLYDRGPVFYKQERLTFEGGTFTVLKFRSMRVDSEEKGARLATKHDTRVTPVGKVIRNLHLDELPQLFNVIKGDMSLVGPRPERREIADQYKMSMPEFDYRLKVKAGLTGYAQVYGKYNTTPYDKLKMDLYYIQNYSFWLDIKILLLTFKILFQKENTEGVESWQVTAEKPKRLKAKPGKIYVLKESHEIHESDKPEKQAR